MLYQVINVNTRVFKIRPPKVCDISPGIAAQVINFVDLEAGEIETVIRSNETWDASTQARVLAAVGEKAAAKA
jgi:hypothetical protein